MKLENKIILAFFIAGALYLSHYFAMGIGVNFERQHSICVTPYTVQEWRSTIKIAKGIFIVERADDKADLKECRVEEKKWRDWYFGLKRQIESNKPKEEDL